MKGTPKNDTILLFVLILTMTGVMGCIARQARVPLTPPVNEERSIAQASRARLEAAYSHLPLSFEVNQGQVDSQVKFLSRGRGYTLFLTSLQMRG